jgi:hypothetical protein
MEHEYFEMDAYIIGASSYHHKIWHIFARVGNWKVQEDAKFYTYNILQLMLLRCQISKKLANAYIHCELDNTLCE